MQVSETWALERGRNVWGFQLLKWRERGQGGADGSVERERLREWDFPGALNRERAAEKRRGERGEAGYKHRSLASAPVRPLKGQVRVKRKGRTRAGASGDWERGSKRAVRPRSGRRLRVAHDLETAVKMH